MKYIFHYITSFQFSFLINFIIIFISLYSITFSFNVGDSKYGDSRTAYFKDLKNLETKYKQKKILYFRSQKWSGDTWHSLNSFLELQNKIKDRCKLEYAANLTNNSFYYALLNYHKIQIIPFFFKRSGEAYRKHWEPNLINKLQHEINNNNILIITTENNNNLINLSNYSNPDKINLNISNNIINKFLYIYYPKKCDLS